MVPREGQRRPWATLPSDRKWYPLYADERVAATTPSQRSIVGAKCAELADRLGYGPDGVIEAGAPLEVVGRLRRDGCSALPFLSG